MGRFTWAQEHSVGVAELDEQHRRLFERIEKLDESAGAGPAGEGARESVEALLKDCEGHFTTEELLMERLGYPGLVKQRVQHRRFLGRLAELRRAVEQQGTDLTPAVVDELGSWLLGHVLGLDREYVEFFRKKGVR